LKERLFSPHLNCLDADELSNHYFACCSEVLDQFAPASQKSVIVRDSLGWFTQGLREDKIKCRNLEKKWRRTRLQIDLEIYKSQRRQYHQGIVQARVAHMRSKLSKSCQDPKSMWKFFATITGNCLKKGKRTADNRAQVAMNDSADAFNDFFLSKVDKIIEDIHSNYVRSTSSSCVESSVPILSSFSTPSINEVRRTIQSSPRKNSSLDPIPNVLVRSDLLLHATYLRLISQSSFASARFPNILKNCMITPVLKNHIGDPCTLSNYRPVTNLSFVSKGLSRPFRTKCNFKYDQLIYTDIAYTVALKLIRHLQKMVYLQYKMRYLLEIFTIY
jgi:hypothetical protein